MNAKQKRLINKYAAELIKANPEFEIDRYVAIWWNPLSWFFSRFKKIIAKPINKKKYKKAVKIALKETNFKHII